MLKKAAIHLVLIAVCLLCGVPAIAEPYIQADLSYQNTATSSDSTSSESYTFVQGYSVGFTKLLTNTISLHAEARLTQTDNNGQKTETLYPMLSLSYQPPSIYYFSFGYNRTETGSSESSRLATSNLNSSLSIPLEKFPSLTISYNRSTSQDYNVPHNVDNVSTDFGAGSSYNFTFLQTDALLNYSYSRHDTEDKVSLSRSETPSHNATVDVTRLFLEKKLRTSFRAGYSRSENKNTSLAGETQFEQKLAASEGLFEVSQTPTVSGTSLESPASLVDGDTSTGARRSNGTEINLNVEDSNIGFGLQNKQKVEKIYIYVNKGAGVSDETITNNLNDFGFQLYTSDNKTNWSIASTPTISFDKTYSRLVFTFTETEALYFKIVNTGTPLTGTENVVVTEIEAYGFLTSTPMEEVTNVTTREFAGATLSYAPSRNLSLTYNMNYDHTTQSISSTDTVSTNHGVSLNYIAIPQYLTVTSNYTKTDNTGTQESSGSTISSQNSVDSYTIAFSTNPLPTASGNVNYGHFVSTSNNEVSSVTDTVAGSVFLIMYKGANLSLSSSFSMVESPSANSTTDSLSNTANFALVPWRGVNVTINTGVSTSETVQDGASSENVSTTLNSSISYTPTRRFYVSAVYSLEPTNSQTYLVNWSPTNAIQTGARLGLTDTTMNYGLSLNWSVLSRLTMYFDYSSSESTGTSSTSRTRTFSARATLRF